VSSRCCFNSLRSPSTRLTSVSPRAIKALGTEIKAAINAMALEADIVNLSQILARDRVFGISVGMPISIVKQRYGEGIQVDGFRLINYGYIELGLYDDQEKVIHITLLIGKYKYIEIFKMKYDPSEILDMGSCVGALIEKNIGVFYIYNPFVGDEYRSICTNLGDVYHFYKSNKKYELNSIEVKYI